MPKAFSEKKGQIFSSATIKALLEQGYSRNQIDLMSAANRDGGVSAVQTLKADFDKKPVPSQTATGAVPKSVTDQATSTFFEPVPTFSVTDQERADIEATQKASNQAYFDRQRNEAGQDYGTLMADYDRLVQYADTDRAKALSTTNKTFARAMERAGTAYGQRGLLGSGIQKSQTNEATWDYVEQNQNINDATNRTLEGYANSRKKAATAFERLKTTIGENEDYAAKSQTVKEIDRRSTDFYYNQLVKDRSAGKTAKPTTPYTV